MSELLDLSAHAPPSVATDATGLSYGVNGIDRPFIRDGISSVRNWGIDAPPAPAAGAASGTGLTGTFSWRITWFNSLTGEYGGFVDTDVATVLTNDGWELKRPSITVPVVDPQVTHWRVWRTTDQQATTYYLVDTVPVATTVYVDNNSDDVVSSNEVFEDHSPPSGTYRWVKVAKGRIILYGSRVEEKGTVTVNAASPTVTGVGTQFRSSMAGQMFYRPGDSKVYTILSVTSTTVLTLTENYVGVNGAGVSYRITAAQPSNMAWNNANSESFDPANAFPVFASDGDFPTGLEIVGGVTIFWKNFHAYGYEFGVDPDPTGAAVIYPILTNRGVIRNELCIVVGGVAYCVDRLGVYRFDGAGAAEAIDQGIRRYFFPDESVPEEFRVNWAYTHLWHGKHDPRSNCVVIFLTTGSDVTPKTEFVFEIDRQRWTANRRVSAIFASEHQMDSSGEIRMWVTNEAIDAPWAYAGRQSIEGTVQGTTVGVSTASAAGTLTDAAAGFLNAGGKLRGMPVVAMTTTPQERQITDNTATVLTISPNWDVNPPAGTAYIIGGIECRWKYNWKTFDPTARQQLKTLYVYFEPTTDARVLQVRVFRDHSAVPIKEYELGVVEDGVHFTTDSRQNGWVTIYTNQPRGRASIEMPQHAEREFCVEFRQWSNGKPIKVLGCDFDGGPTAREK